VFSKSLLQWNHIAFWTGPYDDVGDNDMSTGGVCICLIESSDSVITELVINVLYSHCPIRLVTWGDITETNTHTYNMNENSE
jgi:hypothetical protein